MKLVKTSYSKEDVIVLLQDVEGKVPVLDTKEREVLNQNGVHYSEMLPVEYVPTQEYLNLYKQSLSNLSIFVASGIVSLSEKLIRYRGTNFVLVSLARAGTPIGILVKKYLKETYDIDVPHYSISIIRGKGIDVKAMEMITDEHNSEDIVFLDGWVGKGAINKVLEESCDYLKQLDYERYKNLNSTLAVLTDPASVTNLYGTRQDFLIPSACLNATVSGLFSRTVKTKDMTDEELHGSVYYENNVNFDMSNEFIEEIAKHFSNLDLPLKDDNYIYNEKVKGIDEVHDIAKKYSIQDINKIKPGVGETTRVLLRRLPDRILINPKAPKEYVEHIIQLAKEKNVPIEEYPFIKYNVCGIIKGVSDL